MTGPEFMQMMLEIRKNHQHIIDTFKDISLQISAIKTETQEFKYDLVDNKEAIRAANAEVKRLQSELGKLRKKKKKG